jgi:hypothetical protein
MGGQVPQNYANHGRFDRVYIAAVTLAGFALAASVINLTEEGRRLDPVCIFLLTLATLVLVFKVRLYSVTVQDRIVRLEMRLRLERVLPGDLKGRIGDMTLPQLIGLRFASDEEMPALVQQVLDERITKADEIKKRVKNWQADDLRV